MVKDLKLLLVLLLLTDNIWQLMGEVNSQHVLARTELVLLPFPNHPAIYNILSSQMVAVA